MTIQPSVGPSRRAGKGFWSCSGVWRPGKYGRNTSRKLPLFPSQVKFDYTPTSRKLQDQPSINQGKTSKPTKTNTNHPSTTRQNHHLCLAGRSSQAVLLQTRSLMTLREDITEILVMTRAIKINDHNMMPMPMEMVMAMTPHRAAVWQD